jgi:hypothetical protein
MAHVVRAMSGTSQPSTPHPLLCTQAGNACLMNDIQRRIFADLAPILAINTFKCRTPGFYHCWLAIAQKVPAAVKEGHLICLTPPCTAFLLPMRHAVQSHRPHAQPGAAHHL